MRPQPLFLLSAALCALAFSAAAPAPPLAAQPRLEAPRQSYAELEQAARRLLSAYAGGDASKLWDSIAQPRKNGVALSMARTLRALEEKPEHVERFKTRLTQLDPQGKLKLKSVEDLRAVSPADYFALGTGMMRAAAHEPTARILKGQWYMVEREMGLVQLRDLRGFTDMVSRGYVRFESIDGHKVSVSCMPDDEGWRVVAFEVQVGELRLGFSGRMLLGIGTPWSEVAQHEARAVLGTLKDRARVVHARNPNSEKTMASLGLGARELDGACFTSDCYSVVNTDPKNWTAMCKQKGSDGPIMVVVCNLERGLAQFFEFVDELDMQLNPPKLEEGK